MRFKPFPSRGDLVRVRLDPIEGSEQGGERPALVLSPDVINEYCPVILIAAITTKKADRIYPFEVLIQPPEGGLTQPSQPSKVLLMHLRSVDNLYTLLKLPPIKPTKIPKAVSDCLQLFLISSSLFMLSASKPVPEA